MQQKFQFVTVDSVLAKYHRDFRGLGLNESDGIEWVGEALGFAKQVGASEEAVVFLEVKNYQAELPTGLHYIIQVARNNQWCPELAETCTPKAIVQEIISDENHGCASCSEGWTDNLVPIDCDGEIMGDYEVAYYRPFFDLQYEYGQWAQSRYYKEKYSPVRLSDHSFFNSLVCNIPENEGLYSNCRDEYTVVQDNLRFSFQEGFVAVAYTRQKLDPQTGYPMVPDDESARAAITYYMAWKMKQREWIVFNREGSERQATSLEAHWLKYIKQFKSKAKMPSGADEWQNLMDQSNYLLPRRNRYYGFFGKLSTQEPRPYNNQRMYR